MLKGKNIVVGVTGGIAAYKIPYLIRLLVREEAAVRVIMTPSACDFVTPLTLATLSKNEVVVEPFNRETGAWNNHVELGQWADLMLFAPVTANTMAKMAHGIADNFLTTAYLSAKCPVMLAPSMDLDMFQNPVTQENLRILKSFGHTVIEPRVGELASGLTGPGRMEEPDELFRILSDFFFQQRELTGKKVLVTAGPTYEMIDPVRFIGNRSSGKMGFSLALEAAERGGEVTLIAGPVKEQLSHPNIRRIDVRDASGMLEACQENITSSDILIMAAAVADYTVQEPARNKLKKSEEKLTLSLTPTTDILKELSRKKTERQCFVGFALETENGLDKAREKLKNKSLDLIVLNSLNDKGAGFDVPTNKVTVLTKDGQEQEGILKSKEVAKDIISAISEYMKIKGIL